MIAKRIKIFSVCFGLLSGLITPIVLPQIASAESSGEANLVNVADLAQLTNLTLLVSNTRYSVKACKRHVDSIYGPLWDVTIVVGRKVPRVKASRAMVWRGNLTVAETQFLHDWFGNVQAYKLFSSQLLTEELRVHVWEKLGAPGYEYDNTQEYRVNVSKLVVC